MALNNARKCTSFMNHDSEEKKQYVKDSVWAAEIFDKQILA